MGSGGSMLVGCNADVYPTGEMSHHAVLASITAGRQIILCGMNTEGSFLPILVPEGDSG
ncbi:hypothetical protein EV421DRAFT_1855972 [Armillaria borealis]|uniref:Uncharacterized protein n=1 Tax=Armillaria borealis TaxID=47425 RepID=A0AA39IUX6_9AGAR|nr:hypothetical protein EV421DRAFT_1855972 [Armillaria borealis]